ncbi:MAG: hypothetical protein C4576_30350 [Desulfobacteraceae bacterium]|nr:MAG: hypothetical protein C4576_30350 [Desulfobacteraceae bacterium]
MSYNPYKGDYRGTTYNPKALRLIAAKADCIRKVALTVGVSENALAGCLAEESSTYNDCLMGYVDKAFGCKTPYSPVFYHTHDQWKRNYDSCVAAGIADILKSDFQERLDKLLNPVLAGVGPFNTTMFTAIRLLEKYIIEHPASDPLDIKHYAKGRYEKLAESLGKAGSDDAVKFAGLMIKEAQKFYSEKVDASYWQSLSQVEHDGLMVTYFKVGKAGMENRYQKGMKRSEVYQPHLGGEGEGGSDHVYNARAIGKALGNEDYGAETANNFYCVLDHVWDQVKGLFTSAKERIRVQGKAPLSLVPEKDRLRTGSPVGVEESTSALNEECDPEIPLHVEQFPDLPGLGSVHDLHHVIARRKDGIIENLVQQFQKESNPRVRIDILDRILLYWTGNEAVDRFSRGENIDGGKLAVLESFTGGVFFSQEGKNPGVEASLFLNEAYRKLQELFYGQLMAQTHLTALYAKIARIHDQETCREEIDLTLVSEDLKIAMAQNPEEGRRLLADFCRSLRAVASQKRVDYLSFRESFVQMDPDLGWVMDSGGIPLTGSSWPREIAL